MLNGLSPYYPFPFQNRSTERGGKRERRRDDEGRRRNSIRSPSISTTTELTTNDFEGSLHRFRYQPRFESHSARIEPESGATIEPEGGRVRLARCDLVESHSARDQIQVVAHGE